MAAVAFKAIRLLLGLLLVSGSLTTSALSATQRRSLPAILVEERTTINDYNDDDDDGDDDAVIDGQTVYDGRGHGWTSIKLGSREPVEVPAEVEDEDIRYVYREPEVIEEKRGTGGLTKRKRLGFMGLDNVDYVASTLDLHRTLVGGRNNNNNHNNHNNNAHGSNGPSSGTPDEPRNPLATPTRHRTNHRPSMTSRFPFSSNVSPSDMRRMMKTLLDAGKRRR